eukprot:4866020-Prymnesium_polylepis.1
MRTPCMIRIGSGSSSKLQLPVFRQRASSLPMALFPVGAKPETSSMVHAARRAPSSWPSMVRSCRRCVPSGRMRARSPSSSSVRAVPSHSSGRPPAVTGRRARDRRGGEPSSARGTSIPGRCSRSIDVDAESCVG